MGIRFRVGSNQTFYDPFRSFFKKNISYFCKTERQYIRIFIQFGFKQIIETDFFRNIEIVRME